MSIVKKTSLFTHLVADSKFQTSRIPAVLSFSIKDQDENTKSIDIRITSVQPNEFDETIAATADGSSIDLEGLLIDGTSPQINREISLYTCSCGVPECAGYWSGVYQYVLKQEGTDTNTQAYSKVIWVMPEESSGYPASLVNKTFEFDYNQYTQACLQLVEQINLLLEGDKPESIGWLFEKESYEFDDEGFETACEIAYPKNLDYLNELKEKYHSKTEHSDQRQFRIMDKLLDVGSDTSLNKLVCNQLCDLRVVAGNQRFYMQECARFIKEDIEDCRIDAFLNKIVGSSDNEDLAFNTFEDKLFFMICCDEADSRYSNGKGLKDGNKLQGWMIELIENQNLFFQALRNKKTEHDEDNEENTEAYYNFGRYIIEKQPKKYIEMLNYFKENYVIEYYVV